LTNINSGYTLNANGLPSGASVTGYTGNRSETLTITVPASAAGQSFSTQLLQLLGGVVSQGTVCAVKGN